MQNINLNLLLKMKKLLISAAMMLAMMTANAENLKVTSPDGRLIVNLTDEGGIVT